MDTVLIYIAILGLILELVVCMSLMERGLLAHRVPHRHRVYTDSENAGAPSALHTLNLRSDDCPSERVGLFMHPSSSSLRPHLGTDLRLQRTTAIKRPLRIIILALLFIAGVGVFFKSDDQSPAHESLQPRTNSH
jgi:hypothetical protein